MTWRDTFDETIRDGIFALLILQVLSEGDKNRHEVHRAIGIRTDGVFCKTASLHLSLHKLLLQKLITFYITPTDEAHGQILYHLEDSGKEYLAYGKIHLKNVTEAILSFFGEEKTPD